MSILLIEPAGTSCVSLSPGVRGACVRPTLEAKLIRSFLSMSATALVGRALPCSRGAPSLQQLGIATVVVTFVAQHHQGAAEGCAKKAKQSRAKTVARSL